MGKPGKVPSKENLTSPWVFEICRTICTRRDVKEHVFKYRRAHLSYCCSVWGCRGDAKLNYLAKIAEQSCKNCHGQPFDSSAAPLLQRLGWLSVDRLTYREASTMVYKSLNGFAPDNLCKIFSRLSDVHNRVLRNTKYEMRSSYTSNENSLWSKLVRFPPS